jgi:hypothetical protein
MALYPKKEDPEKEDPEKEGAIGTVEIYLWWCHQP